MGQLRAAAVANQIPEIWASDLYAQAEKRTFWHRFEGPEGSSMPIIRKDDLEKEPGDTIKVDAVLALTGAGQTGDTTQVEGNEEEMKLRQTSFTVEALSHAVRWSKKVRILINHNMRRVGLQQLSKWLAGVLDNAMFDELSGQAGATVMPTKNKYFAGDSTTRDTIDSGDGITLDDISKIKALARTDIQMEPLSVDGEEEFYGLVLHNYAALQLKLDPAWQQAQREAQIRGSGNPLFRGALGMWDGVILFENDRVEWTDNANTPVVKVADNIFFGAQAGMRGYAYYPDWVEQEFDYGREIGIATYVVNGEKLIVFDLNATETTGDATDDTALGIMVAYSYAPKPAA
jgi:N4-gp56 family major capsid protein